MMLYRRFYRFAIVLPMLLLTNSCSTNLSDYEMLEDEFNLKTFFNGNLIASGIVQNRGGKVIRRFNATILASWQDKKGKLVEDFVYDDGETQRRIWLLTQQNENCYVGTAGDVVGEAEGCHQGFAFHWNYVLTIPVDGSELDVSLDDWMYLSNDKMIINKTEMTKFGVRIGDITLVIQKV